MDVTEFTYWQALPIYRAWEAAATVSIDPGLWDEADAWEQCTAVLEWAQAHDPQTFQQYAP